MMYANLKGADGRLIGSVAVDPSAPGGLQGALSSAVNKLQAQQSHGLPMAARPMQPGYLPPVADGGMPVSQSRAFVCELRWMGQAANGQRQMMARAINCPPGLPPGIYMYMPHRGR